MAPVRAGQIIYEVSDISEFMAQQALHRASAKMPFKTKVVKLIY